MAKMKRHMRCHTGERPYQCPHCTYASPDTFKLKRHLRSHTGEKPFECDNCYKGFSLSNSLKAHRLIHSGDKPVFQCELCPTTCGRETDLRQHVMKLHNTDQPMNCKMCGKLFPDMCTLKVHKKTHKDEKCFKCNLCPYSSIEQRHLKSHMLIHTDQKPFNCDLCDQSFRQKPLLKRHQNLCHNPNYTPPTPKEKTHECPKCSRSFHHKGNLINHMALHKLESTAQEKTMALKTGRQEKTQITDGQLVEDLEEIKEEAYIEDEEEEENATVQHDSKGVVSVQSPKHKEGDEDHNSPTPNRTPSSEKEGLTFKSAESLKGIEEPERVKSREETEKARLFSVGKESYFACKFCDSYRARTKGILKTHVTKMHSAGRKHGGIQKHSKLEPQEPLWRDPFCPAWPTKKDIACTLNKPALVDVFNGPQTTDAGRQNQGCEVSGEQENITDFEEESLIESWMKIHSCHLCGYTTNQAVWLKKHLHTVHNKESNFVRQNQGCEVTDEQENITDSVQMADPKDAPEKGFTSGGDADKSTKDVWDENMKPRVPYATLIATALRDLGGCGTTQQIFKHITDKYPYYAKRKSNQSYGAWQQTGWVGIRRNLKSHPEFVKVGNKKRRRGHLWTIKPGVDKQRLATMKLKCDFCEFKTKHKGFLQRHLRNVHKEGRDFACEFCEYRASTKGSLKTHVTKKHSAERKQEVVHRISATLGIGLRLEPVAAGESAKLKLKPVSPKTVANTILRRMEKDKRESKQECAQREDPSSKSSDSLAITASKELDVGVLRCVKCNYVTTEKGGKGKLSEHILSQHVRFTKVDRQESEVAGISETPTVEDEEVPNCSATENASFQESETPAIDDEDDANRTQSADTSLQNHGSHGEEERRKKCHRRTLGTLRPFADFLRCHECSYVTTEKVKLSEHVSSQHVGVTNQNLGLECQKSVVVGRSVTPTIEDEASTSPSANTSRQTREIGEDQRRKKGNKRTLVALRPVADFLRCNKCSYVTTEKARMSQHISSHSNQELDRQNAVVGISDTRAIEDEEDPNCSPTASPSRQNHEDGKEDRADKKRTPEAMKEPVLDGLGGSDVTVDWQMKFTDFVGAGAPKSEPVSDGSPIATTHAQRAPEDEKDQNASDANRQNRKGDVEESPVTAFEFMVVEDIQEEVEIVTDANANYQ